jgi:cytidylate kinase
VVTPASRIVITVDGLAASGKSSIARHLARRLGFVHFSSGLLYRAVGWEALARGIDLGDEGTLGAFVESHSWEVEVDSSGMGRVLVDGRTVAVDLSDSRISEAASCVATSRRVRQALVQPQRQAYAPYPIVGEGRDLGTVIFPDAQLKLFVEAPEDLRISRRIQQWREARGEGVAADESVLRAEIIERDRRDAERAISPTVAAPDAVRVDNGGRALTEVVDYLYTLASSRGLVASD